MNTRKLSRVAAMLGLVAMLVPTLAFSQVFRPGTPVQIKAMRCNVTCATPADTITIKPGAIDTFFVDMTKFATFGGTGTTSGPSGRLFWEVTNKESGGDSLHYVVDWGRSGTRSSPYWYAAGTYATASEIIFASGGFKLTNNCYQEFIGWSTSATTSNSGGSAAPWMRIRLAGDPNGCQQYRLFYVPQKGVPASLN